MSTKRQATQAEVQEALRDYDDEFLLCRDLRHAWREPGDYFHDGNQICRVLTCRRCGVERRDVWSSRGERIESRYWYPDDYSFEGVGSHGVEQAKVRLERVRRVKVYSSRSALTAAVYDNGGRKRTPHLLWEEG